MDYRMYDVKIIKFRIKYKMYYVTKEAKFKIRY